MADETRAIVPEDPQRLEEPSAMPGASKAMRRWERRAHERAAGQALTRRAVAIGMLLVVFVAAFTPYNDYVLQNSPFIGNHFPIGIMSLMAVLILLVNPALHLIRKRALTPGELVVITTMMLMGAAAPSSGLMRYLEPMLISPYLQQRQFRWFEEITKLIPWPMVPTTDSTSPLVTNYWLGIDPVRGGHVPILAFVIPSLVWGVLIAAIMGGAIFLAAIFRKQWVHHERLTFPLATIPLELMAEPDEGRWYNALWRNPVLWAGAAMPFLVYMLAGLHSRYAGVPWINLQFDVKQAFTDRPWDALPAHLTQSQLYFAVVGICFFVPSEIALSMWLFVVVNGLVRVVFARSSFDPGQEEGTRAMGVYVAYFAGLLWLARGHLKFVLVSAWNRAPQGDNEPVTYRTMVLGWLICTGVAWVWLMAVGMNWFMALLLLGLGTMLMTLMARIVTETGLFFVGPAFWPNQIFSTLLGKAIVAKQSFLWTQIVSRIFYADLRENIMPYAANVLRMGQEIGGAEGGRERSKWFRWLGAALLVSVLVSGAVHHYLSYTHGRSALNDNYASNIIPFDAMQDTYRHENSPPEVGLGESWGHFSIGAGMAVALMVGRVMWAGWPLHPIGLVLMNSGPMQIVWFSIFIGWGAKRLLLRYGGAGAFRRARPFFIGLIVGETLSAGAWMFVGLLTHGVVRYTLLPR